MQQFDPARPPSQAVHSATGLPSAHIAALLPDHPAQSDDADSTSSTGSALPLAKVLRPNVARPLRVLIVEDSLIIQHRLAELFKAPDDFRVIGIADSESSAQAVLTTQDFDVAIVDMMLARVARGTDVIKQIRIHQNNTYPLVIVLTNFVNPQFATSAKAAGADYFLDKSNDFEKVVPLITHYFQLRP